MKAHSRETYRARTLRVGFEPSQPLRNAIDHFGKQAHSQEVIAQTTAFRAIDLSDGDVRQTFDQETSGITRSLRELGRHTLSLASGIEVQSSPQSMRLFFTPEDPRQLKNVLRKIETMQSGELYDRPVPGLFIDIARASLRNTSSTEITDAIAVLRSAIADPDGRSGFVLRSPRLIIRDIDRFPRRNQRAT